MFPLQLEIENSVHMFTLLLSVYSGTSQLVPWDWECRGDHISDTNFQYFGVTEIFWDYPRATLIVKWLFY